MAMECSKSLFACKNWSPSLFSMCGLQPCYCLPQQGGPGCHSHGGPFTHPSHRTLCSSVLHSLPPCLLTGTLRWWPSLSLKVTLCRKNAFPSSPGTSIHLMSQYHLFSRDFLGFFFLSSFSTEGTESYSAV